MKFTPQEKENHRRVTALLTARAWQDHAFKHRYVSDPKGVLAEEGITLPDNLHVKVLQDTETVKHIVLSPGADPEQHTQQFAHFNRLLTSVLKKHEARVVQQTETTQYVVLPTAPGHPTTAAGQAAAAEPSTAEAGPPPVDVATTELMFMDACFTVVCEATEQIFVEAAIV